MMKRMRQVFRHIAYVVIAMAFTTLWAQQIIKAPRVVLGGTGRADSAIVCRDTLDLPLSLPGMLVGERDTLTFDFGLERFYSGLDSLRQGKDTIIRIVHLGDSHIQAGYYSGRMMRLMHETFGNAGRGWIAPYKLGRTNEPSDYFISSVIRNWSSGKCTQRESRRKAPVGLGGFGISAVSPSINFDVIIAPNNGKGYSFNKAILYRGRKSMPMLPAGDRKADVTYRPADTVCAANLVADTFLISSLTDTLELQSSRRKKGTDRLLPASSFRNVYYGLSLENGNPGILYHSIGVNGAMYVNYTDTAYVEQLAQLKPDLIIVSMGTNESFGRNFRAEEFEGQIRALVSLLKDKMPETALLLTTPPECYRRVTVNKKRVYKRNENTEAVAEAIVKVAREDSLACWDLFNATGGKNSSRKWLNYKLMGRDRIHFTKEGYKEQGTLLFRGMMNSYLREGTR